ncbi:hypothetical protein [Streptomyces sp. TP-A0874]|uniref:hypothetical protein n=1 Tax=Streptomyces sp. TP-A0874 TaxID=549819 RepID=UPI000853DA45|nr:hypothetical protein [Streptomyces sp. TP-A0874]
MEAERLRFDEPPETDVSFSGSPGRESTSHSERRNLPDPVEEFTDYRDVRVDYTLATALTGDDQGRPDRSDDEKPAEGERRQTTRGSAQPVGEKTEESPPSKQAPRQKRPVDPKQLRQRLRRKLWRELRSRLHSASQRRP